MKAVIRRSKKCGGKILICVSLVVLVISSGWGLADCPSDDLTGDCFVDLEDFALLANQWLTGYDLNDLAVMANQWLSGDPNIPDDMAYILGGEFEMGDHFAEGGIDELPLHAVLLDAFFMSRYEITNQQYCDYLNSVYPGQIMVDGGIVYASSDSSNDYPYSDTHSYNFDSQIDFSNPKFSVRTKGGRDMSNDPMVVVSWYGAVAYCNWLSSEEGKESCYNLSTWECDFSRHGYRLPTEAEWEYAARGGEHNPYYRYPWGDNIDGSKANYWQSNDLYETGVYPWTTPVGYYDGNQTPAGSDMANGYGLYDMTGNVWEWCNDWYDGSYYEVTPYDNPQGPVSGIYRALRGGSWHYVVSLCRVSNRVSYFGPDFRSNDYGFRVVLDLK